MAFCLALSIGEVISAARGGVDLFSPYLDGHECAGMFILQATVVDDLDYISVS